MKENLALLIPTLKQGGMERVAANLSKLLEEEYNIYIIVYEADNIVQNFSGQVINLNIPNTNRNIIKNFYLFIKRVDNVRLIKKRLSIKKTISFSEGPNIINILSKYGDKTILTVHSIKSKRLQGIYGIATKVLMTIFYNRANLIVAVSSLIKKDLIENFKVKEEKINVIYNPLNNNEIDNLLLETIEEQYNQIFQKKVIVNVGRLTQIKGQEYLIKAFALLSKKRNDINLVLIGDGELRGKLKNVVMKCGVEKSVFFLGFHNNPYKFLAKSDLFVLTSFVEGFPNVIIEALYCGVPIISTDCQFALREVLEDEFNYEEINHIIYQKYGVLVPNLSNKKENYDIEMLLSIAIETMIDDEMLKSEYACKGKNKVKEYLMDNVKDRWISILQD